MPTEDLRQWLEQADHLGQVQKIDGADWNEEIACITELMLRERKEPPALLFDHIKDYPPSVGGSAFQFSECSKRMSRGNVRQNQET